MLVTFQTQNAADVVMFEKDARAMLKLMGRNDSVPGAMYPADVDDALARLRAAVKADTSDPEAVTSDPPPSQGDEEEHHVSTRNRAFPLIQLLESAAKDGKHVMWEGDQSATTVPDK